MTLSTSMPNLQSVPMPAAAAADGDDFHLHNSFTFWIARLASVMREQFNQALADHDVTWPQWMILNVLHHNLAVTPAQIADNIGVDRSAVTRLVDRLEKKNMVQRSFDGLDRRSIQILMTPNGKQLVAAINSAAKNHQDVFLSQLPSTECRGLKGNIQKLLRAGGVETMGVWRQV